MKRFSQIVLLCVMVAGLVLYGCGSDSDPADGDVVDGDVTDGDTTDGDTTDGDAVDEDPVEQPDLEPGMVQLNGSVEKGPFVLGSSITISPVDASGNPTGQQFTTQTFNDMGEFSVNFEAMGFVSLEGSGFYYNEVTGDLSGANLTLRAFYEIVEDGAQNAHLNLLTHLTYNRVKNLVQSGTAISVAITQAEAELIAALPIGPPDFTLDDPAIELTLQGGDTLQNAYLFAVSSVLSHAARLRSPNSPDAALQELINGISADLAANGELSASTVQNLVEAQTLPAELGAHSSEEYLIPATIKSDLEARFAELGSTAVVPDLDRILDSDFDSIANADDNCWFIPNLDQTDDNDNDIGDACDLTFTDPDTGLVWMNISTYLMDEYYTVGEWEDAALACEELDFAGFTDWRAPSVDAIRSLVSGCAAIESNGACQLHNNCLLGGDESPCLQHCESCDATDAPYWKDGVLGTTLMWVGQKPPSSSSYTRIWRMDFETAEFTDGPLALNPDEVAPMLRCVRGHSSQQELLCGDNVDDDGDNLTDCADDDCSFVPSEAGMCGNIADLRAMQTPEFTECANNHFFDCEILSYACSYCFMSCIEGIACSDVCNGEDGGYEDPACIACIQTCYGGCFGTFTCDVEIDCSDGIDNDEDTLTDMNDPDCVLLGATAVDGDVDDVDTVDDVDDVDVDGVTPTVSPVVDGHSATFYYVMASFEGSIVKVVGDFQESPWNPSSGIEMILTANNVWMGTATDLP